MHFPHKGSETFFFSQHAGDVERSSRAVRLPDAERLLALTDGGGDSF